MDTHIINSLSDVSGALRDCYTRLAKIEEYQRIQSLTSLLATEGISPVLKTRLLAEVELLGHRILPRKDEQASAR